jgi:hypothetical protein
LLTPALGRLDGLPDIHVDGKGDAVVAWQNTTRDGDTEKIVVARNHGGGPFAEPIAIATSYFGGNFDSEIGPGGQAILAWDSLTAPVRVVIAPSPNTPFAHATTLTDNKPSDEPAIGPGGRALAVFTTRSSLRYASTR